MSLIFYSVVFKGKEPTNNLGETPGNTPNLSLSPSAHLIVTGYPLETPSKFLLCN